MTDCLACFEGSLNVSNFQMGNLLWNVHDFFNNEAFQIFVAVLHFAVVRGRWWEPKMVGGAGILVGKGVPVAAVS